VSLAEAGAVALPDRAARARRTRGALILLVLVVAAASLSIGAAAGSPFAILGAVSGASRSRRRTGSS
jgi:hypothetical protein